MKKILTFLAAFLGLFVAGYAQNDGKVNGTVIDGSQKTIESATIALLRVRDSSTVKFSIADKTGRFAFENYGDNDYQSGTFSSSRARGTEASPSNLLDNDHLFSINGGGCRDTRRYETI